MYGVVISSYIVVAAANKLFALLFSRSQKWWYIPFASKTREHDQRLPEDRTEQLFPSFRLRQTNSDSTGAAAAAAAAAAVRLLLPLLLQLLLPCCGRCFYYLLLS